ncbi:PspC domain-containing protein [Pseudalkalibacillus hwajinpoensis]|uniref:PspC domain-containing protein n=1 Tax=Guptibacillus hwajinpoensis TaxID=208199 RepID=UPI00325AAD3C
MKLYKSTTDKKLSGVLGGLSEEFGIDVSILRIVYFLLAFLTAGPFVLIYIAAAIILPTEDEVEFK